MLKPGDTFDRYTVESVLGQGGMGCVYQARDARLDRRVALKIVVSGGDEPDPEFDTEAQARMQREARAAAALDHPNVVAIYDIGEVTGIPYIAMELVTGRTLRDYLGDAPAPFGERLRWLLDVARALAAAHKAGLVHRDIKPENVMVRNDGRVKVLDFGIARRSATEIDGNAPTVNPSIATLTAKGIQIGTPMYMAPEQIRGEPLDGRTDQFAWGVLAYEILGGSGPWKAREPLGLVADILTKEPLPLREGSQPIPADVEKVVLRALSKAPVDRFASMEEVAGALEAHLAGAPRPASAPPAAPPQAIPAAPRSPGSPGGPILPKPAALAQATDFKRYSTQDIREIVQRALEREEEGQASKFTYRDLVEAAHEVGISEEALRAASRELEPLRQMDPVEVHQDRVREKQKLLRHVAIYAVFVVFFFLLDMVTAGGVWWFFPALGWGVGVASHAAKYLFPVDPGPRRSRREKRKKRDRNRPGDARERDIDDGVSALLTATQRHARIAASAGPKDARLRFGPPSDSADEELAQEQAEARLPPRKVK